VLSRKLPNHLWQQQQQQQQQQKQQQQQQQQVQVAALVLHQFLNLMAHRR
jgi:hypothetical protein